MRVILDECSIALGGEPSGGFTLLLKDIEGLQGIELWVPLPKDTAERIIEGARKKMGVHLETANMSDLRKETSGTSRTASHLADAELSRLRRD